MRRLGVALLVAGCVAARASPLPRVDLPPVVIVPGDGSNQLEAKLDKPSVPHFYCSKKSDWYRLWLDTANLLALTSCWADNIRLAVNPSTGRATNAPGVVTRVPYWGSTEGFEELDPSIPGHATAAFRNMVLALVAKGYVRNVTLRGAPYDFRYTPDSRPSYGAALKQLIEQTVAACGGKKVTLISHSMGGLETLYFLRQQTPAWRAGFVARWIPISAPWAGAAKEARLFATGDSEGLPISPAAVRDEQRSYETNLWLMPTQAAVWRGEVLVRTNLRNYTSRDYAAFFADVGYARGSAVYARVRTLLPDPAQGPGVPVLCLYSTGVATPLSFHYDSPKQESSRRLFSGSANSVSGAGAVDWTKAPLVTMGDGDGTVNERSLRVCDGWNSTQADPVAVRVFEKIAHSGMITDAGVIQAVLDAITDDEDEDAEDEEELLS